LSRLIVPFFRHDICRGEPRHVASGRGRPHFFDIGYVFGDGRFRDQILLTEGRFKAAALKDTVSKKESPEGLSVNLQMFTFSLVGELLKPQTIETTCSRNQILTCGSGRAATCRGEPGPQL